MTIEQAYERHKQSLHGLVAHCIASVPYYRSHWTFDLPEWDSFSYGEFCRLVPVLEKDAVRDDSRAFISDAYNQTELLTEATSGTEGKPIVCYKSRRDRAVASSTLWKLRRTHVADLSPSDRFARFYAFRSSREGLITNTVLYRGNDLLLPLLDLSEERLAQYWRELLQFRPRWLHGPSTTIHALALAGSANGLERLSLDFVELSGEYVEPQQVQVIEETFGCRCANQYGTREYWPIAYSCGNGRLHVVSRNVFLEFISTGMEGINELLLTTPENRSWPLVRYRLGDLVSQHDSVCDCGAHDDLPITLLRGRKADFFKLGNGKMINAVVFSAISRGLSTIGGTTPVRQYQVIKDNDWKLTIVVCLPDARAHAGEYLDGYRRELQKVVGHDIKIDFRIEDFIVPDPRTGKVREFIDASSR